MRIDSHQHFWRYEAELYPWIQPSMEVLRRDYLPDDLTPLLAERALDGSVVVQAQHTLEETHWMLELADAHDFVRGVVGWAPLVDHGVDVVLETLARHPRLRGVRHILHDEPDDRYMLRDDFNRGVAHLKRHGLVYDLVIFGRHLPHAIELVDRHPDQTFVLDHIAKPVIASNRFDDTWARDVRALAERQHVSCKLSGVVTEVRDASWTRELIRPYVQVALEAFGTERVMFGTDWPVCLLRSSYTQWVDTVLDELSGLSSDEVDAIMGENAVRLYGLAVPDGTGP